MEALRGSKRVTTGNDMFFGGRRQILGFKGMERHLDDLQHVVAKTTRHH